MREKVIGIGIVRDLTGLTERQIRYYEDKKLIFPDRTMSGTRKYSFDDVELLKEIHKKMKDGFHTFELRKSMAEKNACSSRLI